jgi:hypothetical protein
MTTRVETLFNHIQQIFNASKWNAFTTTNKVSFNSTSIPYDEYVIENPSSREITVSVPLNEVAYKKTFSIQTDENATINAVINYLQMHLNYYENAYKSRLL